jgi:hypothetical protein
VLRRKLFFVVQRINRAHTVSVPNPPANPADTPFSDYEARKAVAQSLLDSCRAERYVYLCFSALAGAGVLVSLGVIFVEHTFTLAEVGMLSSSGGAIAFTANRILKIQHDVFRVVFGMNL